MPYAHISSRLSFLFICPWRSPLLGRRHVGRGKREWHLGDPLTSPRCCSLPRNGQALKQAGIWPWRRYSVWKWLKGKWSGWLDSSSAPPPLVAMVLHAISVELSQKRSGCEWQMAACLLASIPGNYPVWQRGWPSSPGPAGKCNFLMLI